MTPTPRLVPDRPSDQIERAAKAIYALLPFGDKDRLTCPSGKPAWVERGNSDKQELARQYARAAVAAAPPAAAPADLTIAHPSRGVVDEDAVDVALQAFVKASYEWSQRDLDGRDEPRNRYALRAVVEAIKADLPALGAVDDAAVERALAEYNRADFAWVDAMVKPVEARHRFAMSAAIQAAALPAVPGGWTDTEKAWFSVCDALSEIDPDWMMRDKVGVEAAVSFIRQLGAAPAAMVLVQASDLRAVLDSATNPSSDTSLAGRRLRAALAATPAQEAKSAPLAFNCMGALPGRPGTRCARWCGDASKCISTKGPTP